MPLEKSRTLVKNLPTFAYASLPSSPVPLLRLHAHTHTQRHTGPPDRNQSANALFPSVLRVCAVVLQNFPLVFLSKIAPPNAVPCLRVYSCTCLLASCADVCPATTTGSIAICSALKMVGSVDKRPHMRTERGERWHTTMVYAGR